ncbi:MAG: hypothetical protein OEN22_08440 [Gammaproteobacteria bacterium]|nr:hypothetical protein [Gammaproteobacteria bacterium]
MTELPYSLIDVQGADAFGFLQGQLTHDLALLDGTGELRAAWCNPKGRVICVMKITASNGGFVIVLPTDLADDVLRRLTMFRFRAKVEFSVKPATRELVGLTTDDDVNTFLAAQIRRGIPEIWHQQSEKFTPHMLNLDLLDAISFDKGCYTGQEVVARTHYRGATRRRCLRFRSAEPVRVGDKITNGERDIGEVLNAIGNDLLAVVPVHKADQILTVNGVALTHQALPYL